jgi:adenine phosphoribosyltransferase
MVGSGDAGRRAVLRTFRWVDGHGDVWAVLADGRALAAVVDELAAPWHDAGVTHVAGLEARGFPVGAAVAVALGAGFVPVRKRPGSLPGPTIGGTAAADHRGLRHELHVQVVLGPGDRVLLVDDWAERGSQAEAAAELVRRQGAEVVGLALVVDELPDDVRARLGRVTSLVSRAELGASG